ncbi:MAG TPA: MobC family plasmid mobilization relaxosome protein [Allosphingosinicella sp.]|nr:MobC family plasmid mobilization relaxosome protein [Allosphingosinicella sp.]
MSIDPRLPAPLSAVFDDSARPDSDAAPESPPIEDKPLHPVSLRMTFEQKAQLERDAAGMSVAAYIRWRLFDPDSPPPRTRGKFPVKDHKALTKLLALLGQSRIANNVNQLAKAANSGSLPLSPDTERVLQEAAADIAEMRRLLLEALNMEPDG